MKILSVTILILLLGCVARQPMEELEEQALITGDWSKVERREIMDKKMGMVNAEPQCSNGYVMYCHKKSEREVCGCVSPLDRQIF